MAFVLLPFNLTTTDSIRHVHTCQGKVHTAIIPNAMPSTPRWIPGQPGHPDRDNPETHRAYGDIILITEPACTSPRGGDFSLSIYTCGLKPRHSFAKGGKTSGGEEGKRENRGFCLGELCGLFWRGEVSRFICIFLTGVAWACCQATDKYRSLT